MAFKLFILVTYLVLSTQSHLLPEDAVTDDAEQLNRERRDDFLNSILKTIPFFNVAPSQGMIQDNESVNDDDDDDDEENILPTSTLVPTLPSVSPSSVESKVSSALVLSGTALPSATTVGINATSTVRVSKTPELTLATTVFYTSSIPSPYQSESLFTLLTVSSTALSKKTETKTLLITPTASIQKLPASSLNYNIIASVASFMTESSVRIAPSSVRTPVVSTSAKEEKESMLRMLIMSADEPFQSGPVLPDETNYGDSLVGPREQKEEYEIKDIRYLYSNILIPVMSGIFGALLIAFGIVIYRCLRRRKLKKVRYYGGKPRSGLYRLDQMSLLSELSSDEE